MKKKKNKKKTIKPILHGSKWNFISDLNLACVAGGISVAVLCIVLVPELREGEYTSQLLRVVAPTPQKVSRAQESRHLRRRT